MPKRISKKAATEPSHQLQPSVPEATPLNALDLFHPAVRDWFSAVFTGPTRPQILGWPAISRGDSSLIFAPTGSGKPLAAFLWCINRLMFSTDKPPEEARCRVIYISPIKALAVDVERNLRAPLVGIAQAAQRLGHAYQEPTVAIRTGDTPQSERARFLRHPSDILITTPESLYLLLTSQPRELLRSVDTVILDEIHALVPTKRGSHLSLSLERLEPPTARRLQRIGVSATQRPLEEVARFLGGAEVPTTTLKPDPSQREASSLESSPDFETPTPIPDQPLAEFESSFYAPVYRPVTIIDAGEPKQLDLRVEVPVEDMARLDDIDPPPRGPACPGHVRPSGVPSIPSCSNKSKPIDPRSSSATTVAPPNAFPARSTTSHRKPSSAHTTAASRWHSAKKSKTASSSALSAVSSPLRLSNSASTWAPSISSSRSSRLHPSPAACSASAAPAITSAPSAMPSSTRNIAPISSPAPPSRERCIRARSRASLTPATPLL